MSTDAATHQMADEQQKEEWAEAREKGTDTQCGVSVVSVLCQYGVSMVSVQGTYYVYDICMVSVWCQCGVSMEYVLCVWCQYGASVVSEWCQDYCASMLSAWCPYNNKYGVSMVPTAVHCTHTRLTTVFIDIENIHNKQKCSWHYPRTSLALY
jgi:hypothetical protein